MGELASLPLEAQSKIHEFRNALHTLNQETELARQYHMMTFDSSISDTNRARMEADIIQRYVNLQKMTTRVSKLIESILTEISN